MNILNSHWAKETEKFNQEKINDTYSRYTKWRQDNEPLNIKLNALWEKVKNKHLVTDIINEKKSLTNSNISDYNEFIHTNKETILSEIKLTTKNKPLGSFGDNSLNELINKGLEVFETPLVQMIKDHVDIKLVASSLSSLIMYKAVMKLFMKSAYGSAGIPDALLAGPSTRPREIALFMILGAPAIVGALLTINYVTAGGSKVIVNVVGNNELEGATSVSSSSSLFLIFNKLPRWLKALLKYIALSFIITFITSVIGYNSNIVAEICHQSNVYLVYFLKLYTILIFLVVLYYLVRLYVLKMYANNKEFINPEGYPKFIKNELIELKEITIKLNQIDLEKFYKHYSFLIRLYCSIVLFCLTGLVLSSIFI